MSIWKILAYTGIGLVIAQILIIPLGFLINGYAPSEYGTWYGGHYVYEVLVYDNVIWHQDILDNTQIWLSFLFMAWGAVLLLVYVIESMLENYNKTKIIKN